MAKSSLEGLLGASFQGILETLLGVEGRGSVLEGQGRQEAITCYRERCLVATLGCWECGLHPSHHRLWVPSADRHLSTPAGSTGTRSALGSAHPSRTGNGCAYIHILPISCTLTDSVSTHKPSLLQEPDSLPVLNSCAYGGLLSLHFIT